MEIESKDEIINLVEKIHSLMGNEYEQFIKKHDNDKSSTIFFGEISINATGTILMHLLSSLPNKEIDTYIKYLLSRIQLIKSFEDLNDSN